MTWHHYWPSPGHPRRNEDHPHLYRHGAHTLVTSSTILGHHVDRSTAPQSAFDDANMGLGLFQTKTNGSGSSDGDPFDMSQTGVSHQHDLEKIHTIERVGTHAQYYEKDGLRTEGDGVNHDGTEHRVRSTDYGLNRPNTLQLTMKLFLALTAMSFLWVGSQIPLYLFGSVVSAIQRDKIAPRIYHVSDSRHLRRYRRLRSLRVVCHRLPDTQCSALPIRRCLKRFVWSQVGGHWRSGNADCGTDHNVDCHHHECRHRSVRAASFKLVSQNAKKF